MSFWEWLAPSGRAEQAGMFLAGASVPFTFQRTLMPRGVLDQALATGIVMALEYAVGALVQDSVEAVAARTANAHEHGVELEDRSWRRYTMALDLAAIGLGGALKNTFKQREGENVGRAWARLAGRFIANGAFAGLCVAVFQEGADDLHLRRLRAFPVALPGGVIVAGVLDSRRRRAERAAGPDHPAPLKAWEALGISQPRTALETPGSLRGYLGYRVRDRFADKARIRPHRGGREPYRTRF